MLIKTIDGQTHKAKLSTEHAASSYGQPVVVLEDTNEALDRFSWAFVQILELEEGELEALRAAGYRVRDMREELAWRREWAFELADSIVPLEEDEQREGGE